MGRSSQPLLSHNFVVFLGLVKISFSKVSSIEVSIETEVLKEGGENQFVHSLSKPATTEKTLVLERGTGGFSMLMTLASMTIQVGHVYDQIIIFVLDQWGMPKKLYLCKHAILKKRAFSDLDAMSGEVFVERLEFVYRYMTEIPGIAFATGLIGDMIPTGSPSTPARFTPPLDPAPPATPPSARFTPPLDPAPEPKPTPERFTPPLE
jgi:phage tail-like protein